MELEHILMIIAGVLLVVFLVTLVSTMSCRNRRRQRLEEEEEEEEEDTDNEGEQENYGNCPNTNQMSVDIPCAKNQKPPCFKCIPYVKQELLSPAKLSGSVDVVTTTDTNLGGREKSVGWVDKNNIKYIFGGFGPSQSIVVPVDVSKWDTQTQKWYGPTKTSMANDFIYHNDVWKWSDSEKKWTRLAGRTDYMDKNRPSPRADSVSWVDNNGNMYLYGGYVISSTGVTVVYDDMWMLSTDGKWSRVSQVGTPGPRAQMCSVYDNTSGKLYLFGGHNPMYNECKAGQAGCMCRQYDEATKMYTTGLTATRCGTVGAKCEKCGMKILYYGDLWSWNGTEWIRESPGTPLLEPRAESVCWLGSYQGELSFFVFGGYSRNAANHLDETWVYKMNSMSWVKLTDPVVTKPFNDTRAPSARSRFAVFKHNNDVYVMGGLGYGGGNAVKTTPGVGLLSNIWKYSTITGTTINWVHVSNNLEKSVESRTVADNLYTVPSLADFVLLKDNIENSLIVFGGTAQGIGTTNGTWKISF